CLLGRPLSTSAPAATPTTAALCILPRPRLLALGTGLGTFADGLAAFASGLRAFTERLRLSGARSPTRRRALGSFGRACPLRGRLGRPRPAPPSPFSDFTRWCCPAFPTRAACASRSRTATAPGLGRGSDLRRPPTGRLARRASRPHDVGLDGGRPNRLGYF